MVAGTGQCQYLGFRVNDDTVHSLELIAREHDSIMNINEL